jgi:hypothetical protein
MTAGVNDDTAPTGITISKSGWESSQCTVTIFNIFLKKGDYVWVKYSTTTSSFNIYSTYELTFTYA